MMIFLETIADRFPGVTESDVEEKVKNWFNQAKDRLSKELEKAKKQELGKNRKRD